MKKHLSAVRHELQIITLFSAFFLSVGITAFGQIPNYVPSNGLVGWWPFNGNSNDESINTNDGTVNGATLTADRFGASNSAFSFNGIDNHIIIPPSASLIVDTVSFSCWVNPNSINEVLTSIIKKGVYVDATNEEYFFGLQSPNTIYSGINDGPTCAPGIGWLNDLRTSPVNLIGNWTNIVYIYSNGIITIYVNGTSQGSVFIGGNITFCSNTEISIGEEWSNHYPFDGKIDDIGMWNRALTQCEITALYNSQLSNPQLNAGNNLSVCEGDSVTLTATGATTYGWDNGIVNGQVFLPTIEGYYTVVGTDTLGCSNSDSLFLDLLQPTASNIERIACDTYTAPDGNVYTISGQYIAIIPNAEGCDSTIQLALTVNNSSASTQTTAELDSYTWPVNGQTYTQSGVYTAVIPNSKGCDSTITLNLSLEFSGISELNGKEIVITPNPVDASFTLIADSKYIGNEYVLTNQQGAIVGKGTIRATQMEVNCGHLAKGIYLFQINSTDQHVIRVMKN